VSERVLFVDGSSGAAGDMILGALVDLGVPAAHLRRELARLPLTGYALRSRRVVRCGLAARKIDVRVGARDRRRGMQQIESILRRSGLAAAVRERALEIFRRLIEAEAAVHGCPAEQVHLHEAGGIDAIVDVVGAAIGLEYLSPARIVVSALTTGFGRVSCAHGVYPVPGPATLELLRGVPARAGSIEAERLTPTGAAVLTAVADAWDEMPLLVPRAVGYGAGDRDLGEEPNLLRMVLGDDVAAAGDAGAGEVVVGECTVDEATPQALAWAVERLREAGALEVLTEPVSMKKGRSGHRVTWICRPGEFAALARLVFAETTTLGLRYRSERRIELDREVRRVRTDHGAVSVKVGVLDGKVVQAWPEYDECAALARKRGVPLVEIQQAALAAFRVGQRRGRR